MTKIAVPLLALLALLLPCAASSVAGVEEEAATSDSVAANARGEAIVVTIDSIVQPVVAEFLRESLAEADRAGAAVFVIELDTPGGLLESTREIFGAMLQARTPTVVWVAPSGAQAASAGFFLLMAADVAAMAPGTNTGAAHPVGGQGQDIEGTMGEKVSQDAAATIRSLAGRNGRDTALAESAVLESRSFSAEEAIANGLVDVVAPSLDRLLAALDGRRLADPEQSGTVLATADARVRRLEMSSFQRVRSTLAHPNIAYMLLTLGGIGLYFELANPGAILPGVFGAIALLLGLYGMSVLPVNYAGIALLALAAILFVAEIKVQSYGVLTAGGIASLVLGSLMLFRSADPALRVSVQLVVALAVLALVVVATLVSLALRAQRHRVSTGGQGMMAEQGRARVAFGPGKGKVDIHGEIWNAVSDARIEAGDLVEVVEVLGLTLRVRPHRGSTAESAGEPTDARVREAAAEDPAKALT